MNIKLKVNRQENADYFGINIDDIIDIDFERYLIGVVASEIGNANIEACKAQAVASRTYAISRNVLIGEPISDSGNVMAYRAIREDKDKYPNVYIAVTQTQGQILTYNNTPIRAVYSANNGGQTTSSEERWGSAFPYLIQQDDPWDAADGSPKRGHGVGLSQKGAIWAGAHNINYKSILAFYYPNTVLTENYGKEVRNMNVLLNQKANDIIALAKQYLGHPYVYTGAGQLCTPTNRRNKLNSEYPDIMNKCQVLNGSAVDCNNCKYNNKRFFDCRGFTYWILKQNGIEISAVGATSQYNTASSWAQRGKIEDMPNVVCCVFKYEQATKKMKHTGLHIGNGVIIHCTGVKLGEVQYDAVGAQGWTHYAIPNNLYTSKEINQAEHFVPFTGLKKGTTGTIVLQLQQKLNELGYNCTIDGRYGNDTANAVKQFQKQYHLTEDGAAGVITRTLLLNMTINNTPQIIEPIEEKTISNNTVILTIDKNTAQILYKLLKQSLNL